MSFSKNIRMLSSGRFILVESVELMENKYLYARSIALIPWQEQEIP